jgi:hypothetical protein
MRRISLAVAAAAMTIPSVLPVLPAAAEAANYAAYRHNDGYYHGRVWRDNRGRYRCKRSNGTTGLLIGAAGGALVGRSIDSHGSRATGTILGAAAGALIGREVDRGSKYRCR